MYHSLYFLYSGLFVLFMIPMKIEFYPFPFYSEQSVMQVMFFALYNDFILSDINITCCRKNAPMPRNKSILYNCIKGLFIENNYIILIIYCTYYFVFLYGLFVCRSEWILLYLHNHGNIATEGSPTSGLCPTLIQWFKVFFIVHTTINSTAYCIPLNSSEHCIMHNLDDKHPTWPVLEPSTSKFRATSGSNRGRRCMWTADKMLG